MGFLILCLIIVALIITIIMIRNSIVRHHNATIRAWSDVASYERQKLKILDGLQPLVEQYSSFEKGTLRKSHRTASEHHEPEYQGCRYWTITTH